MRFWTIAVTLGACALPVNAGAVPGVTTTDVNFRAGPSTSNQSLGILPGGTTIDITDCQPGGTWCSVVVNGQEGWVSGNYIQTVDVPIEEPPGTDVVEATGDVTGADGSLLSEDELDTLVAPIALYPDNLVAQVLVAATVPIDVVKAERWVEANTELPDDQREAATEAEGWDESVAMLAAGFPDVIEKMADDLDWTEALGEAMLAQSDDVLNAVQRQRARAQAVGNLETNQAQTIQTVDNTIVIQPTDPETVYVPVYDPVTTYTTPATSETVIVSDGGSSDVAGAVAAGAIGFTSALAISAIFNSNNDRYYWYGPPPVHWDNGYFYPRPGYPPPRRPGWGGNVNIGNEINIGNDNNIIGNRPNRPNRPDRPNRPNRPDRPDRPGGPGGPDRPDRPGANRPGGGGGGAGAWRPDDKQRQQARQNIKKQRGDRPSTRPAGNRPAGNRPAGDRRPNSNSVEQRLKAGPGGGGGSRERISAATRGPGGAAPRNAGAKRSGVSRPSGGSANRARHSANRGKASQARRAAPKRQSRPAATRNRPQARRSSPQRRSQVRPKASRQRSAAHRSRGNRSRGGRGGGGRRGGRR